MKSLSVQRRTVMLWAFMTAPPIGAARAVYPDRPVRWIVGFPPGGGTDTVARILAVALSQRLGQPVVIENRPGAASIIGAEVAAKAAPDGLTLLSADSGTVVFNPILYRRLPYDPERDFRPVGLIARIPLVLAVSASSAISTVRELVERAKAVPESLNYGSPGIGSPHHLTAERLCRQLGIRMNHIPYRGAAPVVNDLLAGQVEVAVVDTAAAGEHLRSGWVRPLAAC